MHRLRRWRDLWRNWLLQRLSRFRYRLRLWCRYGFCRLESLL